MLRVVIALVCLVAGSLSGCGHAKGPEPDTKFVIVEKARAQSERDARLYAAVVRPKIEAVQAFRVGGRIAARLVDVGDHVSKGQVLAQLDAADWALNAQAFKGQLTAAIAQRDSARDDLVRFEQLIVRKLISPAELDRQQHAVAAADAQVKALTAGTREADRRLSYVQLRADADGVVTQVAAEPGQVVSEGTPVLTIARTAEREVEFWVTEQRRDAFRVGQIVLVSLWSQPDVQLNARVRWISPAASEATRAFQVRASLVAPPPALGFGVTASVRTPSGDRTHSAVTTPIAAVFDHRGAKAVWIVDREAGALRLMQVEVIGLEGSRYVIGAGVRPGDLVVTAGVHRLTADDRVAVYTGGEQPTQLAAGR